MTKRIVMCFDGTWNTPDNNGDIGGDTRTNVWKFFDSVAEQGADGRTQIKWYDEGCGTKWYNIVVSANIRCDACRQEFNYGN